MLAVVDIGQDSTHIVLSAYPVRCSSCCTGSGVSVLIYSDVVSCDRIPASMLCLWHISVFQICLTGRFLIDGLDKFCFTDYIGNLPFGSFVECGSFGWSV